VTEEAEERVEALRLFVSPAIQRVSAPGLADVRAKHEGVQRSVDELARLSVPVPESLTSLLSELRSELDQADEAEQALDYVRGALVSLVAEIDAALPREAVQPRTPRTRAPKSHPRGFVLNGTHYPAATWIDILRDLTALMAERHPDRVHELLSLRGRTRAYFSRDPSDLRRPELVRGTDIYMDAERYPDQIIDLCPEIVTLFGYNAQEFAILEPD
jgi:hypothetical protein